MFYFNNFRGYNFDISDGWDLWSMSLDGIRCHDIHIMSYYDFGVFHSVRTYQLARLALENHHNWMIYHAHKTNHWRLSSIPRRNERFPPRTKQLLPLGMPFPCPGPNKRLSSVSLEKASSFPPSMGVTDHHPCHPACITGHIAIPLALILKVEVAVTTVSQCRRWQSEYCIY
jgi:hypothetical protein